MEAGTEGRDPLEDYEKIKEELIKYDEKLIKKPHIIIANKMDIEGAQENLQRFQDKYREEQVYPISALEKEGLDELLTSLGHLVASLEDVTLYEEETMKESHVLYKYKKETPFTITRENDLWVLKGHEIETLFYMTRFNEDESVERFGRKLRGMGVEEALEKAGAKRGDEVKILDYIFIFKE